MKSFAVLAPFVLLAVQSVGATPLSERAHQVAAVNVVPTEPQVLQFALGLEQLENAFYTKYLARFTAQDFKNAGFPDFVRGRFQQIAMHEQNHVTFLTQAISAIPAPVPAVCTYDFPVNDVKDFVQLSMLLESIGASAYIGENMYLTTDAYQVAAASITSTEARHVGWINSAVLKGSAWSGAFDTPLDGSQALSLSKNFVTSCPAGNPVSPFTVFPRLTMDGRPMPRSQVTLQYADTNAPGQRYLALLTGLNTIFAPIDSQKRVLLPDGLQGIVYGVVTTDNTAPVQDANTIAGPIVLPFPFPAAASNPQ